MDSGGPEFPGLAVVGCQTNLLAHRRSFEPVVNAWQLDSWESYRGVARLGRNVAVGLRRTRRCTAEWRRNSVLRFLAALGTFGNTAGQLPDVV
jgi:hypothetical protein